MIKFLIPVLFITTAAYSQDNCIVFLMEGDSCRYKACSFIQRAPSHFQLTREFHLIFDEAIEICPDYARSYRSKSVSYLKTGDFLNWKKYMDKAVELDPVKYLDYRGWCRFQFFRDYEGAIKDFERLEELTGGYDIGYSQNGDYHLAVAKGLCYKMLGEEEKALSTIESHLKNEEYQMPYDYLHLGVLYMDNNQYDKALSAFNKQSEYNELADNQFYIAQVHESLGNKLKQVASLSTAKELYAERKFMYDVYTHAVDKVYLGQIEEALTASKSESDK